ncbi:hypothetical protein C8Q70DRAFT_692471 [Cubamyces menziesii]|nr:hypothetical protein C8Q70DRAFT_692471 [Cubamyces menziesii]
MTPSQPPLAQARSHLLAVLMMLMFVICGTLSHCQTFRYASCPGCTLRNAYDPVALNRDTSCRLIKRGPHDGLCDRSSPPPPGRRTSEVGCPSRLESSVMCIQQRMCIHITVRGAVYARLSLDGLKVLERAVAHEALQERGG